MIIGDSMLRDFNDDTYENAVIQCISGARMLDILQAVNCHPNLDSFHNVVFHCGTNDIAEGTPVNDITSSLEAVIIFIQVEAP